MLKRLALLALTGVVVLAVIVLTNSTSEDTHTVVTLNDWIAVLAGLCILAIFPVVIYALKFWIWRWKNRSRRRHL